MLFMEYQDIKWELHLVIFYIFNFQWHDDHIVNDNNHNYNNNNYYY